MDLHDFDYELPPELIAQRAAQPKDSSRLMVLEGEGIAHRHFRDLPEYLRPDDVLVVNETKVSRARIRGHKSTGGHVELMLCGRIDDRTYACRIKGGRPRAGQHYEFAAGLTAEVLTEEADVFTVAFNQSITTELMEALFELPTPPYVKQALGSDTEYQTVYSRQEGSLAAPTAGLHFTDRLLEEIRGKGVTVARVCLHVGFGTFLPVRGPLAEHKMHAEYFEIDAANAELINRRRGRLVVVGTTSVRALESAADEQGVVQACRRETDIFIYPGHVFRNRIAALVTNFHLPRSTLLVLVSAYFGRERILRAYAEAVRERYRFYSLGDAMLLVK